MNPGKLGALLVASTALFVGCRDDNNPGGGDDTSTGGEATTTGQPPTSSSGADTTGNGSASGEESTGSSESSTGEEPPVEVNIRGEVTDFLLMSGVPDAAITIYDNGSLTATADADGLYSIGPFEADTEQFFIVEPSTDYLGSVIPIAIENEPDQEEQLAQISRELVDTQFMLLEDQMPVMPDLTQSIIIVRLLNNSALLEGTVEVEMDPQPEEGTYYAPDAASVPILNSNEIANSALPLVIYYNIEEAGPGAYTFTANHPMRECEVAFPEFPTVGEHITLVDLDCPPAA